MGNVADRRNGRRGGFSLARWERAAFTSDSGVAEIFAGGWIIALRGVVLVFIGFASGSVERVLNSVHLTADIIGWTLVGVGMLQILGPATVHYYFRTALAWASATLCGVMWLAYRDQHLEHISVAWMWLILALSQVTLGIRILLNRRAHLAAMADL